MKIHILQLHHGDLFRFTPDGQVYRLTIERDPKTNANVLYAQPADLTAARCTLRASVEWQGSFVHLVEADEDTEVES